MTGWTRPVTRVTRLRRGVSVNSDSTTVRIGDPEAQNAIRAALRELDKIEGSQAAAKALRDMLENAEAPVVAGDLRHGLGLTRSLVVNMHGVCEEEVTARG